MHVGSIVRFELSGLLLHVAFRPQDRVPPMSRGGEVDDCYDSLRERALEVKIIFHQLIACFTL